MSSQNKKMSKVALSYAQIGLPILPVHSIEEDVCTCGDLKCTRPGKHPRTRHGVKDASSNEKKVRMWWAKWPHANIAIATGKDSGFYVLDIDPQNGGNKSLRNLINKLGSLPKTVKVRSGGGGKHYFLEYPEEGVKSSTGRKGDWSGIDILSDGSYVVAPPSSHKSGKKYSWLRSPDDHEIKPIRGAWLRSIRGGKNARQKDKSRRQNDIDSEKIPEGRRNTTLISIAGTMRRTNISKKAILKALLIENNTRCTPPLETTEVEEIVDSICSYKTGAPAIENTDTTYRIAMLVLQERYGNGKKLVLSRDGRFWVYDQKGVWRPTNEKVLERVVIDILKQHPNEISGPIHRTFKNVVSILQAEQSSESDLFRLTSTPHPVINLANGTLWLNDNTRPEFRDHDLNDYLAHLLPFKYDPDAICPIYDQTLLEIFKNSKNPKTMARFWNELQGYLIQPERKTPQIIILHGSGANGKTLLVKILTELMGVERVFSGQVQDIERDKFLTGNLQGKYLLLDDDVRSGIKLSDGLLKKYSEEKLVTGQFKFRDAFQFINRTVPMLLCNNPPSIADLTHGMMRRLTVIPFDRQFSDKEQNLNLFEKIVSTELPGILNRALEGWTTFNKRGHFKYPDSVVDARDKLLAQANPFSAFIEERCETGHDHKAWLEDFYDAYKGWAESSGIEYKLQKNNMKKKLCDLGFDVRRSTRGSDRIYGIRLTKNTRK